MAFSFYLACVHYLLRLDWCYLFAPGGQIQAGQLRNKDNDRMGENLYILHTNSHANMML